MTLDPQRRQAILDAVAGWLDEHGDATLPPGIDPALQDDDSPPADLASMAGAVLALRHDMKLQTKVLKRLETQLEESTRDLGRTAEAAEATAARATDALVELFDRLRRCQNACQDAGTSLPWLSGRQRTRRLLGGLTQGVELTLERGDELLRSLGMLAEDPTGQRFDPQRMRAVGHGEPTAAAPAEHVLETVRVGIALDPAHPMTSERAQLRPAEVIVARNQGKP